MFLVLLDLQALVGPVALVLPALFTPTLSSGPIWVCAVLLPVFSLRFPGSILGSVLGMLALLDVTVCLHQWMWLPPTPKQMGLGVGTPYLLNACLGAQAGLHGVQSWRHHSLKTWGTPSFFLHAAQGGLDFPLCSLLSLGFVGCCPAFPSSCILLGHCVP